MASSWPSFLSMLIFTLLFFTISSPLFSTTAQALVPSSKTFKIVNEGVFELIPFEYGSVRSVAIPTGRYDFDFFIYTVRPNYDAFYLGLLMGETALDGVWVNRLVWTANWGKPVRDKATITFGRDGNFVLADVDGRIAWQTNTANKGVVDLKLLPNGNLVLLNKQGGYVWQSFDYPRDALVIGQSLVSNKGGPNKIVSRKSDGVPSDGPYSMVLEPKRLAFYYKSQFSPPTKPLVYCEISLDSDLITVDDKIPVKNVTFKADPDSNTGNAKILRLEYFTSLWASADLQLTNYNSNASFLRLESDGNLVIYTYVDHESKYNPWERTYSLLDSTFCQLPDKCGQFGLSDDGQCVACPTPRGLMGWSMNCKPSRLPPCSKNINVSMINYYKLVGVDHFSSKFQEGQGPMKVGQCKKLCSRDCKCAAAFYRADTGKCLITTQLNTLSKVNPQIHEPPSSNYLAFIKYDK